MVEESLTEQIHSLEGSKILVETINSSLNQVIKDLEREIYRLGRDKGRLSREVRIWKYMYYKVRRK